MGILDYVKNAVMSLVEKIETKYKQKLLIKTSDDSEVVAALPQNEDNSGIDINAVVKNMEDPKAMAVVVGNNVPEIISQDQVRNTLTHLDDADIATILEESADILREGKKIPNVIAAFSDNARKIESTKNNMPYLTDFQIGEILSNLKPEKNAGQAQELEQQKIKIVSMKILEHMIKHGGAWHLTELTGCLQEHSKLAVMELCLSTLKNCSEQRKENVTSNSRVKFVTGLLRLTKMEHETKLATLEEYSDKELLTADEKTQIVGRLTEDRQKGREDGKAIPNNEGFRYSELEEK